MKSTDLVEVIGEADDEYIKDAKTWKRKAMPRWAKWSSGIAACLLVVLGVGLVMNNMGASSGSGGDSDLIYMNYVGPVLPLTVQGDSSGITAERNVNFDFSPYISRREQFEDGTGYYDRYTSECIVTDTYVLSNATETDRCMTLLYPFAGNMREWEFYPSVSVDGIPVSADMHPGPYSGGFWGAWGGKDQENGSVNIRALDCFEGYRSLLSTDDYMNSAFDEFPSMDQTAYVYRLHDFVYSEVTDDVNPTLSMTFYVDYEKTHVFSYGMNGCSWDYESGYCSRRKGGIEYRPNASPEHQHPDDGYVILLGEDLKSYSVQGYRDGGCEEGEELNDISCTVTRYVMTLEEIICRLLEESLSETILRMDSVLTGKVSVEEMPMRELYLGLTAELLYSYGIIGDMPKERYDSGMLEDIFSGVYNNGRVIYLSFDVVVPAGKSIGVEVSQRKDASMDYIGKDKGKDGYDMAASLGTDLVFTEQTASISGCAEIEIVGQNFGFDLTNGITRVLLEPEQDHYWMEIRKKHAE